MVKKEITLKNGNKYLVGLVDEERYINCYILKKVLFFHIPIHHYKSYKTIIPDYDLIVLFTISEYERACANHTRLLNWAK